MPHHWINPTERIEALLHVLLAMANIHPGEHLCWERFLAALFGEPAGLALSPGADGSRPVHIEDGWRRACVSSPSRPAVASVNEHDITPLQAVGAVRL